MGTKKNSKGYKETFIGYKLHTGVTDCCLPISAALTAASLHDSQAAIPLMKLTSERVNYIYDLMDAAYDAQPIYEVSRSLGHVPIIDKNGRGWEVIPLAPPEAARYKERTVAERFNSRLQVYRRSFGANHHGLKVTKKCENVEPPPSAVLPPAKPPARHLHIRQSISYFRGVNILDSVQDDRNTDGAIIPHEPLTAPEKPASLKGGSHVRHLWAPAHRQGKS